MKVKTRERPHYRFLRKTYRPWTAPAAVERGKSVLPELVPEVVEEPEWTAEEWERIWRNLAA